MSAQHLSRQTALTAPDVPELPGKHDVLLCLRSRRQSTNFGTQRCLRRTPRTKSFAAMLTVTHAGTADTNGYFSLILQHLRSSESRWGSWAKRHLAAAPALACSPATRCLTPQQYEHLNTQYKLKHFLIRMCWSTTLQSAERNGHLAHTDISIPSYAPCAYTALYSLKA